MNKIIEDFSNMASKYMPREGQGTTKASQIVTAVNRLIFKWYNDGDVYDNTYYLEGWENDLSSQANWLHTYCKPDTDCEGIPDVLRLVFHAQTEDDYEGILEQLAGICLVPGYLDQQNMLPAEGSIYDADGPYEFIDRYEDEYDDEYDNEYDEYDDEYDDEDY